MKRIFMILLAVMMLFAFAACGAKEETPVEEPAVPEEETEEAAPETEEAVEPEVEEPVEEETEEAAPETETVPAGDPAEMTVEEVMNAILAGVETPAAMLMPLDAETFEYSAFTTMPEGAEAVASEGLMTSIAHSVVLVRVADASETEAVAAEIEKNADPRKWICVEAEKKVVVAHDDTILLVMSNAAATDAIVANFDALYA